MISLLAMPMGSYICVTCRSIYDRDQESWLVKIVLDNLIAPFQGSWSLEFTGVQRTKCSHASLVSKKVRWSVDISYSEFILIPWSAPKNNVDRLIPVANAFTGNVYVTTPWYLGSVPAERQDRGWWVSALGGSGWAISLLFRGIPKI